MALYFPQAVQAHLAGGAIRMAHLVQCAFASGTFRTWQGWSTLVAGGHEWTGNGGLISVSEIDASPSQFASSFSLTMSGLPDDQFDAYAKLYMADPDEYRGRQVIVFLQVFDGNWQPLDQPYALATGFMDVPSFEVTEGAARITLQCEGAFVTRKRPRWGFYTDADQQRRYPGDRGLEFTPVAATRNVKQPVV